MFFPCHAEWLGNCSTPSGRPEKELAVMKYLEKLIARVNDRHWILLSYGLDSGWTFFIWGTYPHSGNLGWVTEEEAKKQILSIAKQHLEAHRLCVEIADLSEVSWRVVMRYFAA
jgi:hypothetical protein